MEDHETCLGRFDVYFCQRCRLGFTNPHPTEDTSSHLYDTRDTSDFDRVGRSPVDFIKDQLSRGLLARLVPRGKVSSILDYATGNGRFAVAATKAFPEAQVDAVDFQACPPTLLEDHAGRIGYFSREAFEDQSRRYDLIVLRHVLEHTHHPVRLISQLAGRLTPRGLLYIEVPNLESGCARVFGRNWKGYYVPRHIYHFTLESLTEVTRLAGLSAVTGRNEMPLMGNTLAILTGANPSSVFIRLCGVLLHPVQLMIEAFFRSSTCINARCRLMDAGVQGQAGTP